MFDALETARVEALGARAMGGVRANLNCLATRGCAGRDRPRPHRRGGSAGDRGRLFARERLTGEAPPKAALAGLKLITPWIEDKAGAELDCWP